jgi:hypothetical protein
MEETWLLLWRFDFTRKCPSRPPATPRFPHYWPRGLLRRSGMAWQLCAQNRTFSDRLGLPESRHSSAEPELLSRMTSLGDSSASRVVGDAQLMQPNQV